MFSGLGPSAGLWGDSLPNRSQLGWTAPSLRPVLGEVMFVGGGLGKTCVPWGAGAQERGLARK